MRNEQPQAQRKLKEPNETVCPGSVQGDDQQDSNNVQN